MGSWSRIQLVGRGGRPNSGTSWLLFSSVDDAVAVVILVVLLVELVKVSTV